MKMGEPDINRGSNRGSCCVFYNIDLALALFLCQQLVMGSGFEVISFVLSLDVHCKQPHPTLVMGSGFEVISFVLSLDVHCKQPHPTLVMGSGFEVISFVLSLDVHCKQPHPTLDSGSVPGADTLKSRPHLSVISGFDAVSSKSSFTTRLLNIPALSSFA